MVLHDLHDISAFGYYERMLLTSGKSTNFNNEPTTGTTSPGTKTQNNETIKIFLETSLLTLTNDLFVI